MGDLSLPVYALITVVCILAGIWICGQVTKDLGKHDHGAIVWDEIAGYFVTMFAVPVTLWSVIAGFFVFRILDVWKPWPIREIDRSVHGGVGIMMDDVAAGVVGCVVMHALVFALPGIFV